MTDVQQFPEWDRETRPPIPLPPPKSCDAQIHVYGDPERYPTKAQALYQPPLATFADALQMHRILGFDRTVIVQPTVYGTDHRLLIDTLEGLQRRDVRATAIIDAATSDWEMERLHAIGVCGARINISSKFGMTPAKTDLRRTLHRLQEAGWHARLHVIGGDLLEYADVLRSFQDLIFVIDHMGRVNFEEGLQGRAFQWIVDSLRSSNWWMMLSNGNRISKMDIGWDDALPFGRAYVEMAPERMIWGSDWPHVEWSKRMMNDAEEVELLYRYVDNDPHLIRRILVENPERLFGFAG